MATIVLGNTAHQSGRVRERRETALAAQFQPLDPGIVSADIPAFFIGRNKEDFWVARRQRQLVGVLT